MDTPRRGAGTSNLTAARAGAISFLFRGFATDRQLTIETAHIDGTVRFTQARRAIMSVAAGERASLSGC